MSVGTRINNFISFKIIPFLTGELHKPNVYISHMNFLNWRHLNQSMQKSIPYIKGKCADIGSGNSPYKEFILPMVEEYISIDKGNVHQHMFTHSKEKFIDADIQELPFMDSELDSIILTQVLEHIEEPFLALNELQRVIKDKGILVLSVPFIYQAHAVPFDYFRFSEYALENICKKYDFEILEFHYQGYLGTTLVSIINGFIWELISHKKWFRNSIGLPIIICTFCINNILGLLLDKIKLKNFTPNFWLVVRVHK